MNPVKPRDRESDQSIKRSAEIWPSVWLDYIRYDP
jgi:hypothetical protein